MYFLFLTIESGFILFCLKHKIFRLLLHNQCWHPRIRIQTVLFSRKLSVFYWKCWRLIRIWWFIELCTVCVFINYLELWMPSDYAQSRSVRVRSRVKSRACNQCWCFKIMYCVPFEAQCDVQVVLPCSLGISKAIVLHWPSKSWIITSHLPLGQTKVGYASSWGSFVSNIFTIKV